MSATFRQETNDLIAAIRSEATLSAISRTLRPVLNALIADPSLASGKWHPLGFLWIQLTDQKATPNVRLHVWPEKLVVQDESLLVHDHTFEFTSMVLFGEVNNSEYKVVANPTGDYQLYEVRYSEGQSLLSATGTWVDSHLERSETFRAGQYYGLNESEFHSTTSLGVYSGTLVMCKQIEGKSARVVGPKDTSNYCSERRQAAPEDLVLHLTRAISLI